MQRRCNLAAEERGRECTSVTNGDFTMPSSEDGYPVAVALKMSE